MKRVLALLGFGVLLAFSLILPNASEGQRFVRTKPSTVVNFQCDINGAPEGDAVTTYFFVGPDAPGDLGTCTANVKALIDAGFKLTSFGFVGSLFYETWILDSLAPRPSPNIPPQFLSTVVTLACDANHDNTGYYFSAGLGVPANQLTCSGNDRALFEAGFQLAAFGGGQIGGPQNIFYEVWIRHR